MFSLFIIGIFSSSNYPSFKLEGSEGCPNNITNIVADINEELTGSSSDNIYVYIGKDDVSVKKTSIGTKTVNFIGCGDKKSLTIVTEENQVNSSISATNLDLSFSVSSTDTKLQFNTLSLSKASVKVSTNSLPVTANTFNTDLQSANSQGVTEFTASEFNFQDSTDFNGIDFSNNNIKFSSSGISTKNIKVLGKSSVTFSTTQEISITFTTMSIPITFYPQSNGAQLFFTEYDSSINELTIENSKLNDLTIKAYDTNNLNIKYSAVDNPKTITTAIKPGSNSLNAGQIVGIVIAVILCIVCVLLCVIITKLEAKEQAESEQPLASNKVESE